jgi:Acetyltransferase (GNAT) domain
MSISFEYYEPANADAWDSFLEGALNSTFLHTRNFLSYHKNRFIDKSVVVKKEKKIIAVFPAAVDPSCSTTIVSHPGITYGGLLHTGDVRGDLILDIFGGLINFYRDSGCLSLVYKCIPTFYHKFPMQDDLYALFRFNAKRYRCDISSLIDLDCRRSLTKGRKWAINKARKNNLRILSGAEYVPEFWKLLNKNLDSRHSASAVHSVDEILDLMERFPNNIKCLGAFNIQNELLAGSVIFDFDQVVHTQYLASSDIGRDISALDFLIDSCIQDAVTAKKRWFDFGISNEKSGTVLNSGLYSYKNSFGAGGYVHEFYQIDLRNCHA